MNFNNDIQLKNYLSKFQQHIASEELPEPNAQVMLLFNNEIVYGKLGTDSFKILDQSGKVVKQYTDTPCFYLEPYKETHLYYGKKITKTVQKKIHLTHFHELRWYDKRN